MRRTRVRRGLAEHAEHAGFGPTVRVHRQRRDLDGPAAITAVAAVPAGLATFYLVLNGSSGWQLVVLACAMLLWLMAGWAYWYPVKDPEGRHWFAVAEGGLLVTASGSSKPPRAIPWGSLRVDNRVFVNGKLVRHCLVRQDENGDEHREFDMTVISGRRALIRAVKRGGPVSPGYAFRAVRVVVLGSVTALAVWFAGVPVALNIVLGERPADATDLARICTGGSAFGRAAAYRGPGPHPVAVYRAEESDYPVYPESFGGADGSPKPDAVQLVGCARSLGRASEDPLESCGPYTSLGIPGTGGYWYDTYEGRYRIDLYEARTGHRVGSITLDGSGRADPCDPTIVVAQSRTPHRDSRETTPDPAGYAARLSRFVNNKADMQ